MTHNQLGYCPTCGKKSIIRERKQNGNDKCLNGHTYASTKAKTEPLTYFDSVSVLKEAYLNVRECPHLRLGQAVFNTAYYNSNWNVSELAGSKVDPFNNDSNIVAFLAEVERRNGNQ
jgi:hypothetical protein